MPANNTISPQTLTAETVAKDLDVEAVRVSTPAAAEAYKNKAFGEGGVVPAIESWDGIDAD